MRRRFGTVVQRQAENHRDILGIEKKHLNSYTSAEHKDLST